MAALVDGVGGHAGPRQISAVRRQAWRVWPPPCSSATDVAAVAEHVGDEPVAVGAGERMSVRGCNVAGHGRSLQEFQHACLVDAVADREHVVAVRDFEHLRAGNDLGQFMRRSGDGIARADRDQQRELDAPRRLPA